MRTLAAAGLAILLVAPALEADSGHGVLRIGAEVTAHCTVATAALSGSATIRCSNNAAGSVAASVDGRRSSVVELQRIGPSVVGSSIPLAGRPGSAPARLLTIQF